MKTIFLPTLQQTGRWLAVASVYFLSSASAFAGFTVDIAAPALNSIFYTAAATGATSHDINAVFSKAGTPPNDMIVSTLYSAGTIRIKVLLPPGTSSAFIRGESNDWIGTPGQQPVVGIIPTEITGTCPTVTSGVVFSCNDIVLQAPAGGLSMPLYVGSALTAPKTITFILHHPGAGSFSFGSLTISMQISNVADYSSWWNTTLGSGTPTNPSTDPGTNPGTNPGTDPGTNPGTNPGTDPTTPPPTSNCPGVSTMAASIASNMVITVPRSNWHLCMIPMIRRRSLLNWIWLPWLFCHAATNACDLGISSVL